MGLRDWGLVMLLPCQLDTRERAQSNPGRSGMLLISE